MAGCPDDATMGLLVAGGLSEPERESIAIHASSCELCHVLLGYLSPTATTADERNGGEELVLQAGTQIGRYTIQRRIGAGGMGVVYAALDRELGRQVALKLLRPGGGDGDHHARARLVREARTLAKLSHPNIVAVFDAGEHHGHVFVAMELVDGGSVLAWCAARTRTPDQILDCMIGAGRGLAAAHAAGVVHRDVKPDNILVSADDRARVTDFGLARLDLDQPLATETTATATDEPAPATMSMTLTRTGALLGTPVYMAPEVLRGTSSARTDQWAFCATLYELLAGTRPFPGDARDRAIAIELRRLNPPATGRRVAASVRAVIARGLAGDPAKRWDSMTAVVTALSRARRRRRQIGMAIAAVAVLAVSGVATAIALHEPPVKPPMPKHPTMASLPSLAFIDTRPGCNCPASACDGRCLSTCDAADYRIGAPVPGISVDQRQEVLCGASSNGDTILFLAGEGCAHDHLYLARRRGETFVPIDLTDQIDASRFPLTEHCCTLSADGETVVLATNDNRQFFAAQLDGDHLQPPRLLYDPQLPAGATIGAPVLDANGLTLYYFVEQVMTDHGWGPLRGVYHAQRSSERETFAPGRKMTGTPMRYDYVTGISDDGLSLFMADEFVTRVPVRSSVDAPFIDPIPSMLPTSLYGWRAIPIERCRRILTTITPGGCMQEDITYLLPVQ